jgi:excisionase family DNA binding protein
MPKKAAMNAKRPRSGGARKAPVIPKQPSPAAILADGALSPSTAAALYGGSEALYRKACDDGRLPFTRLGKKRLIPRRALIEFLAKNMVPARGDHAA